MSFEIVALFTVELNAPTAEREDPKRRRIEADPKGSRCRWPDCASSLRIFAASVLRRQPSARAARQRTTVASIYAGLLLVPPAAGM
jgi:hypothetical protein